MLAFIEAVICWSFGAAMGWFVSQHLNKLKNIKAAVEKEFKQ